MEITDPLNIEYKLNALRDSNSHRRLKILLEANAMIARSRALYLTHDIQMQHSMLRRPLDHRRAFALLGLMLGTIPPASFFLLIPVSSGFRHMETWLVALLCWVTMVTGVTGYLTGKKVGNLMADLTRRRISVAALLVPLLGFAWGAVCGAAGGIFIFVIGALFGAIIGGVVGAVALSVFTPLHRLLSVAGDIELRHFLPIAAGITVSIGALILGTATR